MSRNSKNARNVQRKKEWRGNKPGPRRTEPKHGKKNTWHAKLAGKVVDTRAKKREEEFQRGVEDGQRIISGQEDNGDE